MHYYKKDIDKMHLKVIKKLCGIISNLSISLAKDVMDIFWVGLLCEVTSKAPSKKMGLISDRRNKAKQQQKNAEGPKLKKGLFGGSTSHMFPSRGNSGGNIVQKYPPGYYTTPVNHSSSWSHPGQPKFQPNVNPRYQTWVAPRKQPALGQLVMIFLDKNVLSQLVSWFKINLCCICIMD